MTITLNGTTGITTPAETVTGTDVWSVGSTQIYKDTSGNVGVGTSSPTPYNSGAKLIQVNSGTANSEFKLTNSTTGNTNRVGLSLIQSGNDSYIWNSSNSFVAIGTNNTERMRIDSSGNLLVGTTSSTSHKMTVQSSAGAGAIDCVGGSTNGYYALRVDMPSTNTYGVLFRNNGNNVGDIRVNSSSTAYNTSSDYRLKENVAPMTGALATVAQLKPVTYTWKADGSDGQGFIAHELQAVVPDCVTGEKDAVDADGNPVYQGIDTSFLVATLTAAIQELKAELDTVKTELATLKGTA